MEQIAERIVQKLRKGRLAEFKFEDFERVSPPDQSKADGGGADIFLRTLKANGRRVSVKVVKRPDKKGFTADQLKKTGYYYEREHRIWGDVGRGHPNIAPLLGFIVGFDRREFPGLISYWYSNGDLWHYLKARVNTITRKDKLKYLQEVATGLEFLHGQNIAHRDIKAENVLIDDNGVAMLADFGASKDIGMIVIDTSSNSDINHWLPPEYLGTDRRKGDYHNPKPSGDIWSFGSLFFEVMRMKKPYDPEHPQDFLMKDKEADMWPRKPLSEFPWQFWDFLTIDCWRKIPRQRESATYLIEKMQEFRKLNV